MSKLYQVIRFYEDGRSPRVIKSNLTLQQAEDWCNDPETSSMTAQSPRGCQLDEHQIQQWHKGKKHWFDGLKEQKS